MTDRDQLLAYVRSSRRSWRVNGVHPARLLARPAADPVFIVGSPRSGTSFTATTIGQVPGFADLGELRPLKRIIPDLVQRSTDDAARRVHRTLRLAQWAGLTAGWRGIEQTPESTFLVPAIARAFPRAQFVHMVRDGRDVAASLIGLGWLGASDRRDEAGHAFGTHARFWVEPDRADEFARASEARRAAWVWRRYETSAREQLASVPGRALEIRYDDLVGDPAATARRLAQFLHSPDVDAFVAAFGATTGGAAGRWRRDLGPDQLADVEAEAGDLLTALGYR